MTPEKRLNLVLAALAVFYLIQIVLDLVWHNICGHLGVDYCAFWSSGQIANAYGYGRVYDLELLGRVELGNFPSFGDRPTFAVSPFAYLPVFLPPFQLLAILPPALGFWVWTLVNTAAFALYLRFFYRNTVKLALPTRVLAMLSLSLPVYWNLLDGQVNVWLMICVGEFMRLATAEEPLKAGLWLGGLLLKPQSLLLLGPALLFRGTRRIIAGLGISCGVLVAASLAMLGKNGMAALAQVWLGFGRGIPTNDVDSMMNWRMIGFHFSNWFSPGLGWSLAALGIVATIAAATYLWRRTIDLRSSSFAMALLGTMAATGLVAWHAHIHMAMFLIPALILVCKETSIPTKNLLESWVAVPAAAYVLVYLLASLIKLGVLPMELAISLNFLRGASEFGLNAWILAVAVKQSATQPS
jgi:hypothetical protein